MSNEATSTATKEKLKQFVLRIERLEAEKAELAEDIKQIFQEIKSFGMDSKVIRAIIKIRKQDPNERAEMEALLDIYMEALEDV